MSLIWGRGGGVKCMGFGIPRTIPFVSLGKLIQPSERWFLQAQNGIKHIFGHTCSLTKVSERRTFGLCAPLSCATTKFEGSSTFRLPLRSGGC